jgi:hypothetical protein
MLLAQEERSFHRDERYPQTHGLSPAPSDEARIRLTDLANPENPLGQVQGNDQARKRLCHAAFTALSRYNHVCNDVAFLLTGPKGDYKKEIARRFAELLRLPFIEIDSATIKTAHDVFIEMSNALKRAKLPLVECKGPGRYVLPPCVILLDDCDGLKKQPKAWTLILLAVAIFHDPKLRTEQGVHVHTNQATWLLATTNRADLFDGLPERFTELALTLPAAAPALESSDHDQKHEPAPTRTADREPPVVSAEEWYVSSSGQRYGPVSWSQLREWAAAGSLRPTDHVWKAGMPTWVLAKTVAGLGPVCAFVDNGDNTITDPDHGLMWIKDLGLVPGFADFGELKKWDWLTAKEKCEELCYAGHTDWRLCTIPEIKYRLACEVEGSHWTPVPDYWRSTIFGRDFWTASASEDKEDRFWKFCAWGHTTTDRLQITTYPTCGNLCAMPVRSIRPESRSTDPQRRSNEAAAYTDRGLNFIQRGKYDEAISDLDKAITLNPASALAHDGRAKAYLSKGLLSKALTDYREAARLDPGQKAFTDSVAHVENALRGGKEAVSSGTTRRSAPALEKSMNYTCPHCRQLFSSTAATGTVVSCCYCHQNVTLLPPGDTTAQQATAPTPNTQQGGFWRSLVQGVMAAVVVADDMSRNAKTCPYCMKDMDLAACICPHCRMPQ